MSLQFIYEDPQAPERISKPLTVLAVKVTFDIDRLWIMVGGIVTFSGLVTSNGTPLAGLEVYIRFYDEQSGTFPIIERTTTLADGTYRVAAILPFTVDGVNLPCRTLPFFSQVWIDTQYVLSDVKELAVAYKTRIRDFVAPDTAIAGMGFRVEGYLEYESSPGVWSPNAEKTVELFYDTTSLGKATTDVTGYFSFWVSIPTGGTYTLKANYAGEGLPATIITVRGKPLQFGPRPEGSIAYWLLTHGD